MRKSSIDSGALRNRNFVLVCVAAFLLYASVYAVLLPLARSGLASCLCFPFLIGMQVVGPFHAWLADRFRRKHVLVYSFAGALLVSIGYAYATTSVQYAVLALVQGMCFSMALSAGITVSIDVVHSGHRTSANMVYAFISRLGMAVGGVAGLLLMPISTYEWVVPVVAGAAGVIVASWIYVPFRAPIGLPMGSLDRYLLVRGLLPALNVLLLSGAFGALLLPTQADVAGLFVLAALTPWLVRMFVKLSHHCQRATGNMTFNIFMDAGVLLGLGIQTLPAWADGLLLGVALLLYVGVTRLYYRKMRVR